VALIADTLPFQKLILWKKSLNGLKSIKFPKAFEAFHNAIFNLLLHFGTLLESTFPPLTLFFGASVSHEANLTCVGNKF